MAMLEDFRLKVFMTLVQQKSFTKAASVLHVTQPAVSSHISELEKQLNVKLFQRQYGESVLTDAGKVFLKHAERIMADYDRLANEFLPLHPYQVNVSASEEVFDYLMGELLADFCAVHPDVVFFKTFREDADVNVTLSPVQEKRGTFALSFHPSESFADTRLWSVLSQVLKPTLE